MSELFVISRSTMESTIGLLDKLESPHPTDFFVYLDILNKLQSEMCKIDIQVKCSYPRPLGVTFLGSSESESPVKIAQDKLASVAASLLQRT